VKIPVAECGILAFRFASGRTFRSSAPSKVKAMGDKKAKPAKPGTTTKK